MSLLQLKQTRDIKSYWAEPGLPHVQTYWYTALTLLVLKLPNTQGNQLVSSDVERTILGRTKLMPDAVAAEWLFIFILR